MCMRSREDGSEGSTARGVPRAGQGAARAVGEEAASGLGALGGSGLEHSSPILLTRAHPCVQQSRTGGGPDRPTHTYISTTSHIDPSTQHQPEQSHAWVQSGGVTVKGVGSLSDATRAAH